MKLFWSDNQGYGYVNDIVLRVKPTLGFNFEYINFSEHIGEYCPRERANHDVNPSLSDVVELYENRPLNESQVAVVTKFVSEWVAPQPTAEEVMATKLGEIQAIAQALYSQSVSYQDGTQWRGGQASASSIQGAIELAKAKGQTELTLRDAERAPRVYSLAEAEQVALAIGSDYETKFQAKEGALYALGQIDLEAEDALAQINAITLEVANA